MSTSVVLILAVLATSTLSGVFAMGGGVLLLALMVHLLPITKAMIYHGFIQFFSNFFRALIVWRHISVRIMSLYLAGSLVGSYFLFHLVYHPNKALILLFIGLLTLIGPYVKFIHIDIQTTWGALLCGVVISWLNTLAGATGPLVNMFFLKSGLTKYQVIATKSATQSVAHMIKVMFYMGLWSSVANTQATKELSPILILLCALTFAGGWLGHRIVSHMSEEKFRKYGYYIISSFGIFFTLEGLYLLIA